MPVLVRFEDKTCVLGDTFRFLFVPVVIMVG